MAAAVVRRRRVGVSILSCNQIGQIALLLQQLCQLSSAETFTTNAVCKRNNCINPIFPGLEDLQRLEEASWQCSSLQTVSKAMHFCRGAVTYDPALPVLDVTDVEALVRKQDAAATTMYHYHLAGMGLEGWDYPNPEEASDCVKSVWKMVCHTYFPRAQLGCQEGYATLYLRPCQSSCQNYIRSCSVECCDESVQCVFSHSKKLSATLAITQTGYVPHDGPSSLCTGAASSKWSLGRLLWWILGLQVAQWLVSSDTIGGGIALPSFKGCRHFVLIACLVCIALFLQGCDADVPTHSVGNWRAEPDYLITYEFVPPGSSSRAAMLNSCSLASLSQTMQCGGRGVCKLWDETDLDQSSVSFCQCDRDWADPECSTRRKSQVVAYVLSIFTGFLGIDQFYLGYPIAGSLKLATLGGGGAWWIWDIVRIGSAPVETSAFKVAADLPHWTFVLCTVTLALTIGFVVSYITMIQHVVQRRKAALMIQSEEEHRLMGGTPEEVAGKMAKWSGSYGTMEQVNWAQQP
mmetsp:Transcript_47352/g.101424  ORF Transcript_47352/g.101424 Transcript_47352/m.101424 type:complete len:519 (-) Transcript_47352:115-1671(-)